MKKLRKLGRSPGRFFSDAYRKRRGAIAAMAARVGAPIPVFSRTRYRYSVVSAVHDVEPYLDDFFRSMARQSLSLTERIELIMVDDGSTDGSAAIISKWQQKYPDAIRYVRKENGGQASARNLGLGFVTGDWVTFVDPDDFVHARYFEAVDEFLADHVEDDVGLVCCKWVFFHEKDGRYIDNHPLTYRFAEGSFVTRQDERHDFMASSAATSFFRADVLSRENLLFDESLRPNFEDGHFSGRYLLRIPMHNVGFVADAHYYYRKRADGSSTLDRSWANPSRFGTVVERGYLGLLEEAAATYGEVPRSVQRLVLYDVFWYVKRIVDDEASVSFLTPGQRDRFCRLLKQVFEYVSPSTIVRYDLAGSWFFHKVGMLGLFKGEPPPFQIAYVQGFDPVKQLVELSYFYQREFVAERFRIDGHAAIPRFGKVREHDFLGDVFAYERTVWLELRHGYSVVTAEIDGMEAQLSLGGTRFSAGVSRSVIEQRSGASAPKKKSKQAGADVRALRAEAQSPQVQRRFRDAWMLLDRDSAADDNAEHLYRWIAQHHPDVNAFFVLRRSSHDWKRLEREGFRLVEFGSREHQLLFLNAKHVVSSHADAFVLHLLPRRDYGDLLRFKFTFLQHGVIRDDISRWLNSKNIDLFVTSSPSEHESVAGNPSRYKFGRMHTKMVGLARHDALLARTEPTERVVLIMPTWRQYLVGATSGPSTERDTSARFYESTYARAWRSLIHSDALRALLDEHGYSAVFFPHANMQMYAHWFDAPPWVQVRSHETDPVLHKLFRSAALMITDYSSVFFEMGLLDKPVVYYQFDADEMYGGAHPSRLGYFDFERDGFGPVVDTEAALLAALRGLLEGDARPSPEHLRRMRATLPLRDGLNRERTFRAILALDSPRVEEDEREEVAVWEAENASRAELWELAEERWDALCEDAEAPVDVVHRLRRAQAKRGVGKLTQAAALLAGVPDTGDTRTLLRTERAALAAARGHDREALSLWRQLRDETGIDDVRVVVESAHAHARLGEQQEAHVLLDTLPESPVRDIARAEVFMSCGATREALAQWNALLASHVAPSWVRCWLDVAKAHRQLGSTERAVAALDSYAARGGSAKEADVLRIELRAALGETADACCSLKALVSEQSRGWATADRIVLADACLRLGMLDDADAALPKAADAGRCRAAVEEARLRVMTAAQRWRSIADADRAWLEDADAPTRARSMLAIARAHRALGGLDRALTVLDSIAVEGPIPAEVLREKADALREEGRLEEAADVWRSHLDLHPDERPQAARVGLALALGGAGHREEAMRVLVEGVHADAISRVRDRDPESAGTNSELLRVMMWELEHAAPRASAATDTPPRPAHAATSSAPRPSPDTVDYDTAMRWFERRRSTYDRLIAAVRPHVDPHAVFFDVGANIGYFTKRLAEEVHFDGTAYLFEPLPHLADLCRATFRDAPYEAKVLDFGLSDEDAELDIFVAADGNLGWNTMVSQKASPDMSSVRIKVRAFEKCGIDETPSFIKIDVEGAEHRVFRGMLGPLKRWSPQPAILCEVGWGQSHPEWLEELEVFRELERIGYRAYDLDGAPVDVATLKKTTDLLFLPKSGTE